MITDIRVQNANRFVNNKYVDWYFKIILRALSENRIKSPTEYYEKHHIFPRSIWPEYDNLKCNKWNGVLLTAREHYVCHMILIKCFISFRDTQKMVHAAYNMSCRSNSRMYEYFKKNRVFSQETLDKKRKSMIGKKPKNLTFEGRTHTIESKNKMSISRTGNTNNLGNQHSTDTKQRMSESALNLPLLTCPHCGKIGKKNMNRFHFNNCKVMIQCTQ